MVFDGERSTLSAVQEAVLELLLGDFLRTLPIELLSMLSSRT